MPSFEQIAIKSIICKIVNQQPNPGPLPDYGFDFQTLVRAVCSFRLCRRAGNA